jgi:teichuronic acid biosynthesis glycosyltransferase TuaG
MPKVSVIVTTFNREHFLKLTLKSILDQTFSDFEILVVDNFSNYDIESLINNFNDSRITLYKNSNFGIIGLNRNFGIEKAIGDYLAFCDDDDIWVNNKLALQLEALKINNFDLVYSGMFLFNDNFDSHEEIIGRQVNSFNEILDKNPIVLSSVLVKNLSQVRFPIDEKYVTVEDYFLWLNLYDQGFKFGLVHKSLIYYRVSDSNYSVKIGASKHLKLVYLYTFLIFSFTSNYSFFKLLSLLFINILKYIVKLVFIENGFKK